MLGNGVTGHALKYESEHEPDHESVCTLSPNNDHSIHYLVHLGLSEEEGQIRMVPFFACVAVRCPTKLEASCREPNLSNKGQS